MHAFTILLTLSLLAEALAAQAATSPRYLLLGAETAPGGDATSAKHKLHGRLGEGVVAQRATSSRYVLVAGAVGALEAPTTGRPWLTAVRPLYGPLKGGAALSLHGTELTLGTGAAVTVGGAPATVLSRTRDRIRATMPAQKAPGWQPVTVTAGGATSTLPAGIGVLPMMELERPAQPLEPVTIRYRGAAGDLVVWMLGAGNGPFKVPLPGYGHAFELNLFAFIVLTALPVTSPDGTFALPLPALPWSRPLHFQGLVLSVHPGWSPGSFTNVVKL